MIRLYLCECCNKSKDWSEMHNKTLCKNCWIRAYEKDIVIRIKKSWTTKQLNAKVKKIMEL